MSQINYFLLSSDGQSKNKEVNRAFFPREFEILIGKLISNCPKYLPNYKNSVIGEMIYPKQIVGQFPLLELKLAAID